MTRSSRILLAIASLGLLLMFALPLWRIQLEAPQYPEGLGLEIHVNTVRGMDANDLQNINGLNHYIGMKRIEPDAIPELRYMPWIVLGLSALGLVAAATGRRWLLHAWLATLVLFAAAGMIDFWKWEYDYGHNLDAEHAIIKIPDMNYQPPLIGSKQLLNFVATSWPGAGAWAAFLSAGLGFLVAFRERHRSGAHSKAALSIPRRIQAQPIEARQ